MSNKQLEEDVVAGGIGGKTTDIHTLISKIVEAADAERIARCSMECNDCPDMMKCIHETVAARD